MRNLQTLVPDLTPVGSFARDYWVHTVAGLPRGAQTLDVDIAILVPSIHEYREKLKQLDGTNATGIRFVVDGFGVDVIPYGPGVAPSGIVETADGITLDVTGMSEAADGAEQIGVGDTIVNVPTLSSMTGLKLVAWHYRGSTTQKDARDLAPLLKATDHGPHGDALWEDTQAGDRWEYDDMLIGPYKAGKELSATWRPESLQRLTEILDPSGVATLTTQAARLSRTPVGDVLARVMALRAGIADQ